jgi:hypothetical protein
MFGGLLPDGTYSSQFRYYKPVTIDNKIVKGEFFSLKTSGAPPEGRHSFSMNYLSCSQSILIAGGKNDTFLNDINLFLLNQKVWLKVRFS